MFDFFTKSFILSIIDNKNVLEEALTLNVKIFSKNKCKMVKRFLTENQIAFEEVNIDEQPEAVDWLKAQGFQSVPVITSDAETVIGFRPDQLRKLAS